MLETPYLLALGVYLWAGLWIAWLGASPANRGKNPPWIVASAFVLAALGWAVLLPVHVRLTEKNAHKMRDYNNAIAKIREAMLEAEKGNRDV